MNEMLENLKQKWRDRPERVITFGIMIVALIIWAVLLFNQKTGSIWIRVVIGVFSIVNLFFDIRKKRQKEIRADVLIILIVAVSVIVRVIK